MWILIFFFLSANHFLAERQSWGHLPFLSELYRSPPSLAISLASPLPYGNNKREEDDCKAVRTAIIFIKTFPTALFPFHFLPSALFLSLQSYTCFSPYLISSSLCWCFPLFPSFSSPLSPPICFSAFLGEFQKCMCSAVGRTWDFLAFFHEKIERRDIPTGEQPVAMQQCTLSMETGRSACKFWVWLKQKISPWMLISNNTDLHQHQPSAFHPCVFMHKDQVRDWGGARPEWLVVRIIFQGIGD